LLPEATEAHGSPQFKRLRCLVPGDVQSLQKASFCLYQLWYHLPQEQDTAQARNFCCRSPFSLLFNQGVGLG
jgi:hypothetical protein